MVRARLTNQEWPKDSLGVYLVEDNRHESVHDPRAGGVMSSVEKRRESV